ncbi:hypothetical protein AX16_008154 [Volvariella volvacea WC 439]|nr:hypothetical protein AX16_008154 [Volvariella volvacea WC 439]
MSRPRRLEDFGNPQPTNTAGPADDKHLDNPYDRGANEQPVGISSGVGLPLPDDSFNRFGHQQPTNVVVPAGYQPSYGFIYHAGHHQLYYNPNHAQYNHRVNPQWRDI